MTDPTEWRFIPGRINSSDIATRSILQPGETAPASWLYGPDFFYQTEDQWPQDLPWLALPKKVNTKKEFRVHHMVTTVNTFDWNTVKIDTTNLTTLNQLKEEFIPLLQRFQAKSYPEEISRLMKGKPLKKRSHLLPLTPTLGSDGLLRVGRRTGKAKLSYENLHPVILPPNIHSQIKSHGPSLRNCYTVVPTSF